MRFSLGLTMAMLCLPLRTAWGSPPPLVLAPSTPTKPWTIPPSPKEAGSEHRAPSTGTTYDLAGLIDLAESLNPETRQAWNEARAAAAAAGIATSAYMPQLAIEALGGAQRTPLAAPSNLVPKGYFISDTRELLPSVTAKWLLFDFGRRGAAVEKANAMTFVANVAFTGAHQKLIYIISRDYFSLGAASGKLRAANDGLQTAEIDNAAVNSRRQHGVATSVEQARSDRQLAQARYALVKAQGAVDVAHFTLIADIGLPPGSSLDVEDSDRVAMPLPPAATVNGYVDQALTQRPDVIAARSKIDAAEAEVLGSKADFRPTVSALATAFQNDGRLRSDEGPWSNVHRPGGAVFVQLSWTIFDGGARRSRLALAMAERDAATDAYQQAKDNAGKQVAEAFSALRTALAASAAATDVTRAATVSHNSALEAFRHGLATFDDLSTEANALTGARADEEDARANARIAAAALALATGANTGALSMD